MIRQELLWVSGVAWAWTFVLGATPIQAQSLWQLRRPEQAFMGHDLQAREIGDTITILIVEATDVQQKDEREMMRSDQGADVFGFTGSTDGDLGSLGGTAALDSQLKSSNTLQGDAEYKIQRDFADTVTGLVVDKLPNGNLVVSGVRHRIVGGERRSLRVAGIVRPLDIRSDNTVQSNYIANFTMCYVGDGEESQFTRPGWIRRTLNMMRLYDRD